MEKFLNASWIKKVVIAVIPVCSFFSCFVPGSYPYAEKYELNVNETQLIKAIQEFKKENPIYSPPISSLIDGRSNDKNDHWYHVYVYFPGENEIIYFWTREAGKNKTTLAFVSVNEGLTLGHWKDVNKDFSRSKNKEQKQKFEERILNKLKEKISKK